MEYTDIELKNEKWRDIDGYDGMYQVSDLGRVRSRKSGEWRVLSPGKIKCGYLQVLLSKGGKCKNYKVHRLVAQAFIPNYDETKTVINHINEVKTDNRSVNLEWCTVRYNNTYNNINHRRKRYKRPVRDKVKELYNPSLTYQQNIDICKANDVNCSIRLIQELRKDLGLTRRCKKQKLHKVKDIYNPNLTNNENIEAFRAHGVECSEAVIKDLRRDLGLYHK